MNADIVGLQGAPFVMNIEQGKIRELARATFSSHPDYLESDRPVAPVNIFMTRFLWETDESDVWKRVGMDQHKGLHAEQFIEFTAGPPHAGDRLTGQHTIAESFTKWRADGARLDFVAMHSDFRADDGAVVGRMRTLSVEVNLGAGRSTDSSTTTSLQQSPPPRRDAEKPAPSECPTALPRRSVAPLTRTDIVRYAGASGDFQPVHHDEQFARDSGYDAPMAMGMLAAGAVATWATDRFGQRNVRTCRLRFTGKVFPGDTLVIDGTVADRSDGPIVRATCGTAAAGQVLSAELEFVGHRARRVSAGDSGTS